MSNCSVTPLLGAATAARLVMLGTNLPIVRHAERVAKDKNLIAWHEKDDAPDPEASDDETDEPTAAAVAPAPARPRAPDHG